MEPDPVGFWSADQSVPIVAAPPFGPVTRLVLDPRRIAQPSVSERTRPRVAQDGSGVSTVLADLASTDRARFDQIVARIARVIPALTELRVPRASAGGVVGHRLEARFAGQWVPADQLSDGTLLVIALHTAVVSGRTRLLLVDDVDRGLHPLAQRALLSQLLELTDQGVQIVATTHSATVLDQVPPESVRLVHADAAGHTSVRRLIDHPKWEAWSVMRAGEFWTFIGEDWQVDG